MRSMWVVKMKRIVHSTVLFQYALQLTASQLLLREVLKYEADTLALDSGIHDRLHFIKKEASMNLDLDCLPIGIELPFEPPSSP